MRSPTTSMKVNLRNVRRNPTTQSATRIPVASWTDRRTILGKLNISPSAPPFVTRNQARAKALKQRKGDRPNKKDRTRLRTYSFAVTTIVIMIAIAGAYYLSLPTVEHIPANFEFELQEWMVYVPTDAQYVGYVNYGQAFYVSDNSSLFGSETVFELPQLGFAIIPNDLTYELVVQLPEPKYSGSSTVLQLTAQAQSDLVNDITSAGLAKMHTLNYSGYTIYQFLMRKFGDQNSNLGYLTIINHDLILSNDKSASLKNVEAIVDQVSSHGESLFDEPSVRSGVFASGVSGQSYVALYVGMFPTQLNDTKMAIKSVIGNGDSISVSRALLFPTSDIAVQRWNQAHEVYKNAGGYKILDSWLVVTYDYPLARMRTELIGI